MKIKLDENPPVRLVPALARLGHQTGTVPQELLPGQPDSLIWQAAQQAGRFLITEELHPPSGSAFLRKGSDKVEIALRVPVLPFGRVREAWRALLPFLEHRAHIREDLADRARLA